MPEVPAPPPALELGTLDRLCALPLNKSREPGTGMPLPLVPDLEEDASAGSRDEDAADMVLLFP